MSEHPLKIRILLADDHTVVRRGLRMVLEAAPDLEVVAEASDGIEAVERALREDIDLAILDVAMPRRTGLQAARELSRRRPEPEAADALDARGRAVLLRGAQGRRVRLRAQDRGGPRPRRGLPRRRCAASRSSTRPPCAGSSATTSSAPPTATALREEPLTARELEVVKLVAEAYTSEEIAELLTISPRTVERHRENLMAKLGMRDRVQLTRYAIRRGLVEP